MCGIVGAVGEGNVVPVLLEGLRRLEYRGYDSAGVAIIDESAKLNRVRTPGKVLRLAELLDAAPLRGGIGIAHHPLGNPRRRPTSATPIPISPGMCSRSCTTASSRTMKRCAVNWPRTDTSSYPIPTRRSLPIWFTVV